MQTSHFDSGGWSACGGELLGRREGCGRLGRADGETRNSGGISRKALKHWKTALKVLCRSSHRQSGQRTVGMGAPGKCCSRLKSPGGRGWFSLSSEIGFEYRPRAMRLSLSQGLGSEAISESTAGNSGRLLTARSETGLSPTDRPKSGGLSCRI
jgi:hypothetical protein